MDITLSYIKQWKETISSRYSFKFWNCLYGCPIDLIFFMYNIGDAMLDAVLRPNIPQIVCFNMFPDRLDMCRNLETTPDLEDDVQKQATNYIIYHKVLSNFPALILGLFCGAWSDKYGRKLPMVLPSIGTTFAVLLYMLANVSPQSSVAFFLSGSFIHGCFGKTSMISMAVHSYVVDITCPSGRTNKLGLLAAMQFLGMFIGSLIAGLLLDNTSVLTTYCTASACNAIVVVLALTIVKETVSASEGSEVFPCRTIFKPENFKDSLMVLIKKREFNLRRSICALLFVLLLHQTCRTGLTDVTLLYTELPPLSWPTSWFGYLSAADNAAMGVVLLFILPILSNVLKLPDAVISIIGLACASIRFIVLTWSKHTWMVWAAVIVGSLGGMINSPARSLLSKLVHEDEVGKIFSVLGSGETIAKFFALIFTALYGTTLDIFPGMSFLIASALYTIMSFLFLFIHISTRDYLERDNSENDLDSRSQSDECIEMNSKHEINGKRKTVD
ncbi:proton-coupled folate transporter-like [Mya arenaria]|uniref:proton-coupled folate transporter-like n=1 Tax=Mya arenaria TaxID=6604 RepID=UPI0022E1D7C6|nr:proton-coupled folate transporter-like [Mya arenaria]XP_052802386.1 proton-coupled folate transporter-like [Mya arenaria]